MAATLPIIVYGHGDLYAQYFNAIVRSFGTSTFSTLIKLSILLAGTSILLSFVIKREILDVVKWFCHVYVIIYIVFLPKVSVEILDSVEGNKAYQVDNVPLGLGIVASLTTTLSNALTKMTEMNFSLPDDLRYHTSGMVFASQLVRAASQFEITDARFDENIQGFIHQCVFYDILLKKYSINELLETNDIWGMVSHSASPARGFVYTDDNHHSEFTTCKSSLPALTADWVRAVEHAKGRYASRLFSNAADPKEALKKYLNISYGYLINLSGKADQIMKQNLMANALERGVLRMGASLDATAAMQSYAYVRAQEQKRMTNQTVGEMAAYWLPLIKNDLELILYGSFIFVVLLSVFPFGAATLKGYLYTLLWVELWSPLYAVLNLSISFVAHKQSWAATAGIISLQSMPGLLQINSDIAGLAGYLSMSVPALAGGLLWGMHSYLQVSQYVGGMTQSAASIGAGEAVTGNMGFGNTNFGNHNAFNTSNNHVDTSARVSTGGATMQLADGSQFSVMPDGSQVVNSQNTFSNIGASVDYSSVIRSSYTESADTAVSAAQSDQRHYSQSSSAVARNANDIAEHVNTSSASGEGWSLNASSGTGHALGNVHRITENLADRLHISYHEAANVAASIYAEGKSGLSGHVGITAGAGMDNGLSPVQAAAKGGADLALSGGLGGSRSATHNSSTDAGSMYSKAKDFLTDQHYSENVDMIARAAQDKSLRTNNETGNRLLDSLSASFDQAESSRHDRQNNLQLAQTYRANANKAEEYGARIGINGQQELMTYIAKQPNRDGSGTIGTTGVPAVMRDPQLRGKYISQFVNTHRTEFEANWARDLPTSQQALENIYQKNNHTFQDEADVKRMDRNNRVNVTEKAQAQGLDSNRLIDYSIKKQVTDSMVDKAYQVHDKNDAINQEGGGIQHTFAVEETRKRHGGLTKDFIHDIDTKHHE
jgi:conjugal transfer mating pair stabilization protein TraG